MPRRRNRNIVIVIAIIAIVIVGTIGIVFAVNSNLFVNNEDKDYIDPDLPRTEELPEIGSHPYVNNRFYYVFVNHRQTVTFDSIEYTIQMLDLDFQVTTIWNYYHFDGITYYNSYSNLNPRRTEVDMKDWYLIDSSLYLITGKSRIFYAIDYANDRCWFIWKENRVWRLTSYSTTIPQSLLSDVLNDLELRAD